MAQRFGLVMSVVVSAILMSLAMFSFAAASAMPVFIYAGGVFLGAAWAVFYILAPLLIIDRVDSTVRVRYLTYLSGAQMLGLGLSQPTGGFLINLGATYIEVYSGLCVLSLICAGLFLCMPRYETEHQLSHSLTLSSVARIIGQKTVLPAIMIALLACIFSGLATFQSLYADLRGLNESTFFITFTVVTVALRFSVASQIARLPIYSLAISLIVIIMVSLGLLAFNKGSLPLYIVTSATFAVGYGLSYSTLNAIAVNVAESRRLSISASSQIFTLFYFIGIFGFPFVAGQLISLVSMDAMLLALFGIGFGAMALGALLKVKTEESY